MDIATMTWEHSDCPLMTPLDHTFNLVINKGYLYCVMCSSDYIKRRRNIYRDEVGRVLRLIDLEDEDSNSKVYQPEDPPHLVPVNIPPPLDII